MMRATLTKISIVVFGLILLISCKPSDKYVGDWYAISNTGEEVMFNFSKDKVMTLSDDEDLEKVFDINQSASGIQNSIRYFRVEIEGASHYVIFENKEDEDNAQLVRQTNHASDFEDVVGDIIYKMNRNGFPSE